MFAQVIVDVAAYPVDRPFDYRIPEKFATVVEPGSRVKVPFGPRHVLGYVVGIVSQTDVPSNKIRAINEVLDLEPVINAELLQLSKWLKHETICFEIDALQLMVPSALRAKYEKVAHIRVERPQLDMRLQAIFGTKQTVDVKQFEKAGVLQLLKQAVTAGAVELENIVKQQGKVKTIRMVKVAEDVACLQQIQAQIPAKARKQIQLIEWLIPYAGETLTPAFICDEADVGTTVLHAVLERGAGEFVQQEVYRDPFTKDVAQTTNLQLTDEQDLALLAIQKKLDQQVAHTFLLHGVTGSGKTEIYLQAIEQVLAQGKQAMMLVPEIALTPQMTERFRSRFGDAVAVMHSGLSTGEKYDEWRKIQNGEVQVVVGARSAVFVPFTNIGLIILDEEHESTYKQEDSPRYHARDVAIWRSQYHQCPVILGSATPSLESYARAQKGVYTLLTLSERAKKQSLPAVHVVDLRAELATGNRSMFSTALVEAMRVRLEKNEQIVLFLNRRGYSSFVLCRDCGTVVQCKNCDISLTYHRHQENLKCHYCGYEEHVPSTCPQCTSEHIRYFGTGTQKVEEELHALFPEARVLRMDVDTTSKKGAHEEILEAFGNKEANILLGTQMIAKGLDFPDITLVGVLSADTSLHLPDYRAAEKTYQLLTQVSGRAGRHDKPGQVVIQTYTPEHYAIELAKAQVYAPFYTQEMANRRRSGHPPYYYIALVQISHEDVMLAADYAQQTMYWLQARLPHTVQLLGPTAASISRLQNRYRYQCLIKYKIEPSLIPTLHALISHYRAQWIKQGVQLTIDLDPSMI